MKRRNPVPVGKHPDLFGGESTLIIPWRDAPRKKLLELLPDDFDQGDLDEMAEEDVRLYNKIWDNDDKARQKRIWPLVETITNRAKWDVEYEMEGDAAESNVDFFIEDLRNMSLTDLAKGLETDGLIDTGDLDEESVSEILRDIDLYEVKASDTAEGLIWFHREELYGELDVMLHNQEVAALLESDEDVEALREKLSDAEPPVYISQAKKLKDVRRGDFDFTIGVDFYVNLIPDVERMNEALDELEIAPKKEEGPATDEVVYNFPDGFYVAKLSASQLPNEGRRQGMCIGRRDMGYIDAVKAGETAIYSLRTVKGKPKLTFEVDLDKTKGGAPYSVEAVKGKANRLPGFDPGVHEKLTKPLEVLMAEEFIDKHLDIDPGDVEDLLPGLLAIAKSEGKEPHVSVDDRRRARENPAAVRVPPDIARIADEAYDHPWGGRWA